MIRLEMFVCATCFGLTSNGTGMQSCLCEENKSYPGVDCPGGLILCYMCSTTTAGGTSRWSWNACESCLKFNRYLERTYAFRLPLGRHSIMNSIAIPFHAKREVQEEATQAMFDFLRVAGGISVWGKLRARELFESVPAWQSEVRIPLDEWKAKFHLSKAKATIRSGQEFKDYLRIINFDQITTL